MALSIVIAATALACAPSPSLEPIDEATARQQLIDRYAQLFGDKTYRNPLDGNHYPYPALGVDAFQRVERVGEVWELDIAPPAGVSVHGRVDLYGRWVELTRVEFAPD